MTCSPRSPPATAVGPSKQRWPSTSSLPPVVRSETVAAHLPIALWGSRSSLSPPPLRASGLALPAWLPRPTGNGAAGSDARPASAHAPTGPVATHHPPSRPSRRVGLPLERPGLRREPILSRPEAHQEVERSQRHYHHNDDDCEGRAHLLVHVGISSPSFSPISSPSAPSLLVANRNRLARPRKPVSRLFAKPSDDRDVLSGT